MGQESEARLEREWQAEERKRRDGEVCPVCARTLTSGVCTDCRDYLDKPE